MTLSNYFAPDPMTGQSWACAEVLWHRSDFAPKDVACAQIYDAFTPEVIFALEGYGFCGRGESCAFTVDETLGPCGRLNSKNEAHCDMTRL